MKSRFFMLPQSLIPRFALLMLGFAALSVSGVFYVSQIQHLQWAREAARSDAMDRARTVLDAAETSAARDSLSRFIQLIAAKPSVRSIVLVDVQGSVVFSSRRTWQGKSVGTLQEEFGVQHLSENVVADSRVHWNERKKMASAALTLNLINPASDSIWQTLKGGHVLLAVDGTPFVAAARSEALKDAAGTAALVVLMLLTLALVLHYSVGRPIQRLYRYTTDPAHQKNSDKLLETGAVHELDALAKAVSSLSETRFALSRERDRMADIANTIPGAVYEFRHRPDGAQEFTYVSDGIKNLFHLENDFDIQTASRHDLAEKIWEKVLPDDLVVLEEATKRAISEHANDWVAEFRVKASNDIKWVSGHAVKVRDTLPGKLFRGVLLDITRRVELEERLRRAAIHDPLTGALNRAGIEPHFDKILIRAQRERSPVSVIIVDIDYFKHVNDMYGHTTGDAILVELVTLLSSHVRSSDSLVRWGGEEFLILLPGTGLANAHGLAEKLRQVVAKNHFAHHEKLTISIGVAACHNADTPKTIVKRADDELYRAKRNGRNQVSSRAREDTCEHQSVTQ